jgi:hypothetical protein
MYRLTPEQQRILSEATAIAAAQIGPDGRASIATECFQKPRSQRLATPRC